MEFSITKKGYSPAQVDEYLAAIKREYENTISRQRDRITEMLAEKEKSDQELAAYREKSNQIGKAIVSAVAKAEEIERLSRIKYNQEIMRLKAFHEKWTKYYNKILDEYPLDERLAAAGEFNRRMDAILTRVGGEDAAATGHADAHGKEDGVRIGYINVQADGKTDDADMRDLLPDADPQSPVLTGNFDPMERIGKYFAAEKEKQAADQKAVRPVFAKRPENKRNDYADRSPSGFSFEEALNPTEDLESILKDLGL